MTHLIISDETTTDYIELNDRQAIDLELKLNITSKGHEWKHIGDVLYNFGTKRNIYISEFKVSHIQMEFLKLINSTNNSECKKY
jgi:hypothetical protein